MDEEKKSFLTQTTFCLTTNELTHRFFFAMFIPPLSCGWKQDLTILLTQYTYDGISSDDCKKKINFWDIKNSKLICEKGEKIKVKKRKIINFN